ncbi:unnamed protein product [Danaus chrysippus]|uniref:PET117 polypeptide n=2 Tax=Danaus TaxID=13036 RepID=A0A212F5V0_DANPL|nr:protein PET117 homolog, mitochondrial [Danaus plexippus]OWR49115.1 PET117 polypeptide [Danaus plexippus plexippus]CAG9560528.1 unnamed protein product [Danaus chrysippus]
MSSITSKIVLGLSCVLTAATVTYVHVKQQVDRDKMHEGVIKDVERQQKRKIENLYLIEKQNEFAKQLKRDLEKS